MVVGVVVVADAKVYVVVVVTKVVVVVVVVGLVVGVAHTGTSRHGLYRSNWRVWQCSGYISGAIVYDAPHICAL